MNNMVVLPISPSWASSLVELTFVEGEVEFLECDDGGGGGGGGGISSVDVEPFIASDVVSITQVCWGDEEAGESNLEGLLWLKLEDDVGMIDKEGGNMDANVIVAVDSSLNGCGRGGC